METLELKLSMKEIGQHFQPAMCGYEYNQKRVENHLIRGLGTKTRVNFVVLGLEIPVIVI